MFDDPLQKIKVCLRKSMHNTPDTRKPRVKILELCKNMSIEKRPLMGWILLIASITLK
jgi:hypothetical protein